MPAAGWQGKQTQVTQIVTSLTKWWTGAHQQARACNGQLVPAEMTLPSA